MLSTRLTNTSVKYVQKSSRTFSQLVCPVINQVVAVNDQYVAKFTVYFITAWLANIRIR